MTGINFTNYVAKFIERSATDALYAFVKDKSRKKQFLLQSNMTLDEVFEKYRNQETGYLHVVLLPQHSFGL